MEGIPVAVGVLDPGHPGHENLHTSTCKLQNVSPDWWVDVKGDKSKKPIIATNLNN